MEYLTIGQLAKQAVVNIDTIRYYEKIGLLSPAQRKESGYRQYLDDAVLRLRFIKHAKDLGFSLDEISELLSLKIDRAAKCGDIKKRAQRKIIEIDGKMQMLERMRVTLMRLAKTCDEGKRVSECPCGERTDCERLQSKGSQRWLERMVQGQIPRRKEVIDLKPSPAVVCYS